MTPPDAPGRYRHPRLRQSHHARHSCRDDSAREPLSNGAGWLCRRRATSELITAITPRQTPAPKRVTTEVACRPRQGVPRAVRDDVPGAGFRRLVPSYADAVCAHPSQRPRGGMDRRDRRRPGHMEHHTARTPSRRDRTSIRWGPGRVLRRGGEGNRPGTRGRLRDHAPGPRGVAPARTRTCHGQRRRHPRRGHPRTRHRRRLRTRPHSSHHHGTAAQHAQGPCLEQRPRMPALGRPDHGGGRRRRTRHRLLHDRRPRPPATSPRRRMAHD